MRTQSGVESSSNIVNKSCGWIEGCKLSGNTFPDLSASTTISEQNHLGEPPKLVAQYGVTCLHPTGYVK